MSTECIEALHYSSCSVKEYALVVYLWGFFLFCFLGLYLRHMEVPRLEVESKLQLLVYATAVQGPSCGSVVCVCDLHHSS